MATRISDLALSIALSNLFSVSPLGLNLTSTLQLILVYAEDENGAESSASERAIVLNDFRIPDCDALFITHQI